MLMVVRRHGVRSGCASCLSVCVWELAGVAGMSPSGWIRVRRKGRCWPLASRATANVEDSCRALRIRMILCCFRVVLLL